MLKDSTTMLSRFDYLTSLPINIGNGIGHAEITSMIPYFGYMYSLDITQMVLNCFQTSRTVL